MPVDQSLLSDISSIVLLNEAVVEDQEEGQSQGLESKLKDVFKQEFPYGELLIKNASLGRDTRFISITLLSRDDWPQRIIQNDPMHTMFSLTNIGNDQLELALVTGGSISLVPPPEHARFYAMAPFKVPFRKTKGNEDKIVSTLQAYFKKMHQAVVSNEDKIYGRQKIDDKYFQ